MTISPLLTLLYENEQNFGAVAGDDGVGCAVG